MDGGAWKAVVHGVAEGWTWLSDFTFTFHFHALEKEMATHSSVLAWWIPGTGEPGGLPSMGSHRVGHDWSDSAAAAAQSGQDNSHGVEWKTLVIFHVHWQAADRPRSNFSFPSHIFYSQPQPFHQSLGIQDIFNGYPHSFSFPSTTFHTFLKLLWASSNLGEYI